MLEECQSLSDCEKLLETLILNISLINQIPLNDDDFNKLKSLIKSKVEIDEAVATWELEHLYPTCLACFLVWTGHNEYKSGDFWSSVWNSLNISQKGSLQTRWGEMFINFLEQNNLPFYNVEGAHRFVTPILIHGGIPNYCLKDFFQNLLSPVLTGQLKVDISDTNEILNEWKLSSLFAITDKPVQRFLLDGEEYSRNFLSRCIEMARDAFVAHEENELPTEYDEYYLPEGVVYRFREWFQELSDAEINNPGEKRKLSKSSFLRPMIILDTNLDEIRVNIPTQRIERSEAREAYFEVLYDGKMSSHRDLKVYKRENQVIETSPDEIALIEPAEKYVLKLVIDGEIIRVWETKGLTSDRPFLAFLPDSNKLIDDENVPQSYIWIVIPKFYSLDTNINIIEGWVSLYQGWSEYQYCLVDASKSNTIQLVSNIENKSLVITVSAYKSMEPKLVGGKTIGLATTEDQSVYVGKPPDLIVPIYDPSNIESEIKRLRLSIIPKGETSIGNKTINVTLSELILTKIDHTLLKAELSSDQLIGINPAGSFVIRIRGRLGRDKQLNLTVIPFFDVEFDESFYSPDENGDVSKSVLTINTTPKAILILMNEVSVKSYDDGQYVIIVPSIITLLNILWTYKSSLREIQVPIAIQIPRLRWSLRGLIDKSQNEWIYVPNEITLSEYEASEELDLLINAPLPDDCKITLILNRSHKIEQKHLRKGVARFNLKSFSDELRNLELPLSTFYLKIDKNDPESIETQILRIRTEWTVEEISYSNQVIDNNNIFICLKWNEKGRIRNRAIRFWNLFQPWKEPVVKSIPQNESEITINSSTNDLQPGEYRLEFCEDDLWAVKTTPKVFPDRSAKNVFTVLIGDQNNLINRYNSLGSSFREQLEKLALISYTDDNSKFNERIQSMQINLITNDNLIDLLMIMLTFLPNSFKIRELWDFLAEKSTEKEFEKAIKDFQTDLDENDKKRVITVALSLDLTPPDSPFDKHQLVIHKARGWLGQIKGFSSKREYGQWLIEVQYIEKSLNQGRNLLPLDKFEETYKLVAESDLPAKKRKIIELRNVSRNA